MSDESILIRSPIIDQYKVSGYKVAAVFPIHSPRSLLRAHGFIPVEIWGPQRMDTSSADAHLPSYACSIVRSLLSFLLSGKLDRSDILLIPHACDSLQQLTSVIQSFIKPKQTLLPFYLPRGRRDVDHDFLISELRQLSAQLSEISKRTPTDEELHACIQEEEDANQALNDLFRARSRLKMNNRQFYQLLRSREYLQTIDFTRMALSATQNPPPVTKNYQIPIVLSGLLPEPSAILNVLEVVGLQVVEDDLACTGRRRYRKSSALDPYKRMAQMLLSVAPDSQTGCSVHARIEHILKLVKRSGARAVIHLGIKFCEPEYFYLPQVMPALDQAGIPSLQLELDINQSLPDSIVTRIEAFAESIA